MEIDEIREQKMREMKSQNDKNSEQQQKSAEAEMHINDALKLVLTQEAKTRLSNIKLVNKEQYLKVSQFLLYMYKSGKIQGKITEEQLKDLLKKLSEKKEMQIKRK